jgi:hypothetical protein
MTDIEKRPASGGSGTATEVKKDPFKYVPDVIDEFNRDGSAVVNRYRKGLVLGKVRVDIVTTIRWASQLNMNHYPGWFCTSLSESTNSKQP